MSAPLVQAPDKFTVLVQLLERGTTLRAACSIARFSESTIKRWVRAARPKPGDVPNASERDLGESVLEAIAKAEVEAIKTIQQAARGYVEVSETEEDLVDEKTGKILGTRKKRTTRKVYDWRAAAWYLEHARGGILGADSDDALESTPPREIIMHLPPELARELATPLLPEDEAKRDGGA